MTHPVRHHPVAFAAALLASGLFHALPAQAQSAPAETAAPANANTEAPELATVVIKTKRAHRVSKGATNLPMEVKDTPQSISTIEQEDMNDFGTTGSNDALKMGTGINVEVYETNRVALNARGFEIQSTQIDGLGMTNDWGVVTGQQDTFLFDKIELIRGANGLLTGVGNASGTVNYVRKRPTNKDGGQLQLSTGSHGLKRGALDHNKVLTQDGKWAGRVVVVQEDKDSYLRALADQRTSLYGVIDGQIGDHGMLTVGLTHLKNKQKSPMWGSLTLNRVDGSQAEFDVSSSTSQDWTYWNTESTSAFVEYTHSLGAAWEAKLTYNKRRGEEQTRLLYAYSFSGALNTDNTGLVGWPYRSVTTNDNDLLDANVSGEFSAFGREHSLIAGVSHSTQAHDTDTYSVPDASMLQALPAFPYGGNVYAEPAWGARAPATGSEQKLTRFYGSTRLALTDSLKAIAGVNVVKLDREGNSQYGAIVSSTDYPTIDKTSPYLGFTYDFAPHLLGYASYSEIFQYQDQVDVTGTYLDPMKGVNHEIGVKAEWLDNRLLTTFAIFGAQQKGISTYVGMTASGQYYYAPQDVKSRGFEVEVAGRIGQDARLTLGLTQLELTGPDGQDIFEWVPRTTVNLRYDTRLAAMPKLKLGVAGRWQSDVEKSGGAKQGAYVVANAFTSYELSDKATLRLNVNNLFDKKYLGGLAYGAIYGAPRNAALTLEYKL
ncbi:MAG: TonB-dependent siderophore receptor [Hydrogenophaga sp.]|uniref:TonB-dependent siderophore receptor n=1 Tax=Hydrogenophaga sp. TaxID=1904254 RepID=UPI0025C41B20|nr:TonB-dependent siderophore receptor [Hydrogenophaga sp.]MBT9551574.1 TonB-dependent siderophore receptor [Hydrogenophaga sp.]